jgi:hypothetical protein
MGIIDVKGQRVPSPSTPSVAMLFEEHQKGRPPMSYRVDDPVKTFPLGTATYLVCEECLTPAPNLRSCCRCMMVVCEGCWPRHQEHGNG